MVIGREHDSFYVAEYRERLAYKLVNGCPLGRNEVMKQEINIDFFEEWLFFV